MALLGPRQVGKTTPARGLSDVYFDLEQPADRRVLISRTKTRLESGPLLTKQQF